MAHWLSRTLIHFWAIAAILITGAGAGQAATATPGAEPGTQPAAAPNLVIEEPIFDFGTAEEGSTVTHAFKVKNTGNAALTIHKVRPG